MDLIIYRDEFPADIRPGMLVIHPDDSSSAAPVFVTRVTSHGADYPTHDNVDPSWQIAGRRPGHTKRTWITVEDADTVRRLASDSDAALVWRAVVSSAGGTVGPTVERISRTIVRVALTADDVWFMAMAEAEAPEGVDPPEAAPAE